MVCSLAGILGLRPPDYTSRKPNTRPDPGEADRAIESLVEQETDRRVAIWLRVRVGGERMTTVAAEYGYRDGSGVHRVIKIKRLEEKAKRDRSVAPSKGPSQVVQICVAALRGIQLFTGGSYEA